MKNIIYIIISLVLLSSCRNEVDFSPEQRALFLYNVGDNFSLIKNETDTLDFTVTKKELDYDKDYNGLWNSGTYYEHGALEYKNGNNISTIRHTSKPDVLEYYWHHFKATKDSYTLFFKGYIKTDNQIINGVSYKNCYLSTSSEADSIRVSTDVGILYIKSHYGDEYKLLQK